MTTSLEEVISRLHAGDEIELIDGEVVRRGFASPAHGRAHFKLGALLDPFDQDSSPSRSWWLLNSLEILYPSTREVLRHDLVGFLRERLARLPKSWPVEQRPDFVCEILSPSTARYDVVLKQRTLHAHGVPHYWLVDPEHRLLAVMRWEQDQYKRVLDAGIGDVVRAEPFEAIELDVRELFGVEDE